MYEKIFDFSNLIHEFNYKSKLRFILKIYKNNKIILKIRIDNWS